VSKKQNKFAAWTSPLGRKNRSIHISGEQYRWWYAHNSGENIPKFKTNQKSIVKVSHTKSNKNYEKLLSNHTILNKDFFLPYFALVWCLIFNETSWFCKNHKVIKVFPIFVFLLVIYMMLFINWVWWWLWLNAIQRLDTC